MPRKKTQSHTATKRCEKCIVYEHDTNALRGALHDMQVHNATLGKRIAFTLGYLAGTGQQYAFESQLEKLTRKMEEFK